jgi:hypothetical protein
MRWLTWEDGVRGSTFGDAAHKSSALQGRPVAFAEQERREVMAPRVEP